MIRPALACLLLAAAPAAAQPACETRPESGARLGGPLVLAADGHAMEFKAGRDGDAIVKVRDADSGDLVASWYVRRGERAEVIGIPDGDYIVQYAVGTGIAADCRSFANTRRSGQVPGEDALKTTMFADSGTEQVRRKKVTYSFYRRAGDTLWARPISSADFDAE